MVSPVIVAGTGGRITERLIGLIDQLGANLGFPVQGGRMHKAIGMPYLHVFMPGAPDVSLRRIKRKLEDGVIVDGAFVLHRVPCVIEV
jgi:hypothetical protein